MRRSLGLAVLLLLATVNVARALPCAGAEASAPQGTVSHESHGAHEHHQPAAPPPPSDAPAGDPVAGMCCQAMTSCAVTAAPGEERAEANEPGADAAITAFRLLAPESRPAAPEPPPPRR